MAEAPHHEQIARGERFEFGANWAAFLRSVDDERIAEAERSLKEMLGVDRLDGVRVLDVGSGSGLFSLAAHRLGAQVHSFDFDPRSVACTTELRRRFASDDESWTVEAGSVLDDAYMKSLGQFDLVYSWGVLHHTGDMSAAFASAAGAVMPQGTLFIAIYNDQGVRSRMWWHIKRLFCSGKPGRAVTTALVYPVFAAQAVVAGVVRDGRPWSRFTRYRRERGMSIWHDWRDWLGGFPFEYASAEEVLQRFAADGFRPKRVQRTRGWGCNQFVLSRGVGAC